MMGKIERYVKLLFKAIGKGVYIGRIMGAYSDVYIHSIMGMDRGL
jgi:hypothetical protein